MFRSTSHPSLYKKPLLLGLPKRVAMFGIFVIAIMAVGLSVFGLLSAALFAVVYFRVCLRLMKRDSQVFEIGVKYLKQEDEYPSYWGR